MLFLDSYFPCYSVAFHLLLWAFPILTKKISSTEVLVWISISSNTATRNGAFTISQTETCFENSIFSSRTGAHGCNLSTREAKVKGPCVLGQQEPFELSVKVGLPGFASVWESLTVFSSPLCFSTKVEYSLLGIILSKCPPHFGYLCLGSSFTVLTSCCHCCCMYGIHVPIAIQILSTEPVAAGVTWLRAGQDQQSGILSWWVWFRIKFPSAFFFSDYRENPGTHHQSGIYSPSHKLIQSHFDC